jgi:hypothetical protein
MPIARATCLARSAADSAACSLFSCDPATVLEIANATTKRPRLSQTMLRIFISDFS